MTTDQTFTFTFPTTIRFGNGVLKELPGYLRSKGINKPLIVTDQTIEDLPFFRKVVKDLQSHNINVGVFSDIHKNPVKSDVMKGKKAFTETDRDCVIGIGGGASLDVSRAVVLSINHHRDLLEYDELSGGDQYVTEEVPFFITVPTTSGTGSEVGRSAIIGDDETRKKHILFSPKLLAKIVFADPSVTMELPPFITAATGMDALTHNMEAYLAKNYHPMCEGIALEGIRLICNSLEKAVNSPDMQSRSDMLMASMMGAVAFQKGLGVVHSLAHPLSQLLDTHHGLANAVNLPYGMRFNVKGFEYKFEKMAQVMDLNKQDGEAVVNYLFEFNKKIGLPVKLRDINVKEEHIDELSELAEKDFAHPNNPKPVSKEDFKALYKEAL